MTTSDVSAILSGLTDLTGRVNAMVEKLARIDERTSVLTDHETRIRAAEETARIAGETAIAAKAVAEAQAVRIRALEDNQNTAGKFSLGTFGKFAVAISTFIVAVLSIAVIVHNW